MKRAVVALMLMFGASYARADGGWIGPYAVTTIETNSGITYFFNQAGYSNISQCAQSVWVAFVDGETKISDRALAVGLMAQTMGRKVTFLIDGCYGPYLSARAISTDPSW